MKLGKAFSDSLIIEQKKEKRPGKDESGSWWLGAGRALMMSTVLFVALFVLAWRLFALTVVDGGRWRLLADGNRTRELVAHAPRGILLDRTGKPLVVNTPQYRLIAPCDGGRQECRQQLSKEQGEAIAAAGLPAGTFLEVDYQRQYPYGEALAHVLGYTGELSEDELAAEYYNLRGYKRGDRVGRMGAEATFEERLRGRDGRELVEVDAEGKILRSLGRDPEVPGEDIALSLDGGVSRIAAQAFPAGARGAVVVSKPATGEILAIYSSPSYSPNAFSVGLSRSDYDRLTDDEATPLFNRAIGGVYPPGSTFKLVTAVAGLEEGVITDTTTVEDSGVLTIGPYRFPNWYFAQYGKTEGAVGIVKALQRSNDIFFYKAGEWLGITKLTQWAKRLGIGAPLGVELAGEAGGLMPDPAWKNAHFTSEADRQARNNEWYLGDTYHVAIGQGYLLTTPLQVNSWTNIIANNGKLCRPTITRTQNSMTRTQRENCKDIGIKKETIDLITEGMQKACEPGGTGWPLFGFGIHKLDQLDQLDKLVKIPMACKTGTAEFGDPNNKTHAWFTAFAPLPKLDSGNQYIKSDQDSRNQTVIIGEPEISVTVLVEGAGEGSSVAAPIAKKILEEWFSR
ncbi:MAG: penicillin-binding transpeptidase domain-containing protein [Patescibacteria group bacterium]